MKRTIFIAVAVLAAVLVGFFASGAFRGKETLRAASDSETTVEAQGAGAPAPTVLVETAVLKPRIIRRKCVGVFEPIQTVTVVARVSGDITAMPFQEGDFVKPETVLFEIEKIRYEAALEAAKARVASGEAQIATVDARRVQSQARLTYAKNNYERNRTLNEQGGGIVAQDSVENVKSVLDAQEAELKSIDAERLSAVAGLDGARADLKIAQDDFDHTTIYAMIAGRVGRTNFTRGNYVSPASGPLVTVVQMDPIYLRFSISEKEFSTLFGNEENLKKTASIQIELANGEIYDEPGEISFIDNRVTATTNTINVWATFKNTKLFLNPDGVSTVILDKREETLLPAVKASAMMFDGRHHSVYVVDENGLVERRVVEPASNDGQYQTIASGVREGETVVIDGTHKIRMVPGPDGKIPPFKVQTTTTPTTSPETLGKPKSAQTVQEERASE